MIKRVLLAVSGIVLSILCALGFGGRESAHSVAGPRIAEACQQEISVMTGALREIVEVRRAMLEDTEASHRMGLVDSGAVVRAQINVAEARLRLAKAERREEAVVAELRAILAAREAVVQSIRERQDYGLLPEDDLHEALIAALETKVRLARAMRA